MPKKKFLNKIFLFFLIFISSVLALIYPGYLGAKFIFNKYFELEGAKIVELEKRGVLSKAFGAAWQDINIYDKMVEEGNSFVDSNKSKSSGFEKVNGIRINDYPSLSIVRRLNEGLTFSNTILINDRKDKNIATIRTDHTRAKINEFPEVLIKALIAAEDEHFYENNLGFEFDSFVRAVLSAYLKTIKTFEKASYRGTSTITQQVAKLFISHLDEFGQRRVSLTVDRKFRELRLSAALRKLYSADDILEVYLNHCVASDFGLIGVRDISEGLLGKNLNELSDAECIYLARMVKWGSNIHSKISRQCRIDMARMGEALEWTPEYQQTVLNVIDDIKFTQPNQIETKSGHLVDLANDFWLKYLKKNDPENKKYDKEMDIINPNSLIRKKGNLTIQLTVDLPLQNFLEDIVNNRGFGKDTIIYTDVRIGSIGKTVERTSKPQDTLRQFTVIGKPTQFSEPKSEFKTTLYPGDTLVTNIRYFKKEKGVYRRSVYYYTRQLMNVDGQYYSYCIIDSRSGKILAYYSKDKIGSRIAGLLKNPVQNGSSTAKPLFNALNFDLGIFPPYAKWTDSLPVIDEVPWKRKIIYKGDKPIEVEYAYSSLPGKGYRMNNHDYVFEGCHYIFDHLASSNNIFGVESVYRLNRKVFDVTGRILPDSYNFSQFFYRLNVYERLKNQFPDRVITGVRHYKELARIIGVDVDSMNSYGRKVGISDSMYSVALGTLEMTLYDQVHIFNILYNNDLIEQPKEHPSLAIEQIVINKKSINVSETDTIKRFHPFSDINRIRPTLLGLHKRLTSNRWDGLNAYDIPYEPPAYDSYENYTTFNENAFLIPGTVSNFAKSGTTDDVILPFNVDVTSKKRTNYGLWNAVVRVDLSKFEGDSLPEDIRDITLACIGECNFKYTGARDGKSLHKYVSMALLKHGGIKSPNGFFNQYERYLKMTTPDSCRDCSNYAINEDSTDVPIMW